MKRKNARRSTLRKLFKSPAPYIVLLIAVIGMVLTFQSFASSTTGVYTGVFAGGDSTLADVAQFEAITGKKVSIINSFSSWGAADNSPKMNFLNNARAHGSVPMVTWEPWDTSKGVNQPQYSLESIISGQHDAYITSWAKSVKAWGNPLFLRFAHEMNGNWYPWSEQVNGNQPGQYVQAWQHVHDIFHKLGVKNVTWVWCINKLYSGSGDSNSLYPGDTYVDWTAFDAYNRGTAPGPGGNQYATGTWQNFGELIKPTYQANNIVAPGKPQMLAEFGTVEDGGSKADWFTKAFKYELKANYPRIKAVVYFNQNKVYNNLVDSSASSAQAYTDGIGLSYYASNSLGDSKGLIKPLLFDAQPTDITGPFTTITGPYGSSLPHGTKHPITVRAQDRSRISHVDVSVNGAPLCSDASAPYSCAWITPAEPGKAIVTATAYDKLGNSSTTTQTYTIR